LTKKDFKRSKTIEIRARRYQNPGSKWGREIGVDGATIPLIADNSTDSYDVHLMAE